MTKLEKSITELVETLKKCDYLSQALERAVELVVESLTTGHKLLICGNGGSAADAMHLAAEFVCKFCKDRVPWPAIALGVNPSYLTAVGNDYNFEQIFARELQALGNAGDILLAFSTSGNSKNVLLALEEAQKKGIKSIAFLGKDGGVMRGHATVELIVPSDNTARIQEVHQLLLHVLCESVEERLLRQ